MSAALIRRLVEESDDATTRRRGVATKGPCFCEGVHCTFVMMWPWCGRSRVCSRQDAHLMAADARGGRQGPAPVRSGADVMMPPPRRKPNR